MIIVDAMLYALTITIAAGLLLLAVIGLGYGLARRAVGAAGGLGPIRGWRWQPSTLGWLLVPVLGLLLWRVFPALLFVPIILPFFLRGRMGGRRIFPWQRRERRPGRNGNGAVDADYERVDDE